MKETKSEATDKAHQNHKTDAMPPKQASVSRMSPARRLVLTALLLASTIVLSRFIAIRTPIITINFSFLPIMLAGMLMGWQGGAFVAVVADLIGALLFPSGSFFIGYTITALLKGVSAGLLLHNKNGVQVNKKFIINTLICVIVWSAVFNGALNTFWIFITSGGAANLIVPVRIVKQLVMAPIMFVAVVAVAKIFRTQFNQLLMVPDDTTHEASEE